jgi:hypothetical protein
VTDDRNGKKEKGVSFFGINFYLERFVLGILVIIRFSCSSYCSEDPE